MKAFKSYFTSICLVFVFIMTSCEKIEPAVISNGGISLQLWSDWEYIDLHGIDTGEGMFRNCNENIRFTNEVFGFMPLDSIKQTNETIFYEETTIDGIPAKIYKRKIDEKEYLSLAMDAPNNEGRIWLSVTNPDNDQRFITIFKSLLFL